jgi:two-component system response regulator NreC
MDSAILCRRLGAGDEMQTKPSVVIVDDEPDLRLLMRGWVEQCNEARVVGEAADGRQALAIIEALRPTIVLSDVAMPRLNGIEFARQVLGRYHSTGFILITAYPQYVQQAIAAGVRGYLLKPTGPQEVAAAIRRVVAGHSYLTPDVSDELTGHGDARTVDELDRLSSRHREILQLIAEGCSNKEIAVELQIETSTVRRHREELMRRLGFHSVVHLVHFAVRTGIIHIAPRRQ